MKKPIRFVQVAVTSEDGELYGLTAEGEVYQLIYTPGIGRHWCPLDMVTITDEEGGK